MLLVPKAIREAIRHITSSACVAPARRARGTAALQTFMENVVWVWNWPFFIIIFHGVRFQPGRFALSDGKCFILEVIGFSSELLKGTFGVLKGGKK